MLDLITQALDVGVHGLGFREVFPAPGVAQQLLARDHLAGVLHEARHQLELAGRQVDVAGRAGGGVRVLVERDAAGGDGVAVRRELVALAAAQQELLDRDTTLAAAQQETADRLTAARKESDAKTAELAKAREKRDGMANVISGYDLRRQSRRKKLSAANDRVVQLTMEENSLNSRIHMLTEMEKVYEGYSKAVKVVMQAHDRGQLSGVRGPVAGLLKVPDQYTVAIEIALGGAMQNIVVEREEDGKSAIGYLKQRDGGRATFLPMTAVRSETLRENVSGEYGFVGIAADLISYDKQYDGIFKSLLGRTVVVEDLDSGIAMARKFRSAFRIVTLDGQVMNRGGSMTGGSVSRSAGVLSRANELEKLSGKMGGM